MLLDNGQPQHELTTYGPLLQWLTDDLPPRGEGVTLVRRYADLVTFPRSSIEALLEEIAASGVAAVVFVLCHAGVTAPSSMLAIELERRGIPVVLVCTPLGLGLASVTAAYNAPDLPLVPVARVTGASADRVDAMRGELSRAVLAALTGTAARRQAVLDPVVAVPDEIEVPAPDGPEAAAYAFFEEYGLGDGLPVVAPTRTRVDAMLAGADRDPATELIGPCPPSGSAVTIEKAAINAVVAGCLPQHFAIVIAALEAMNDERYRLFQTAITTHPGGNVIVVSGALCAAVGIHGGAGALGPGFRANVAIGRAVSLVLTNVLRIVPGRSGLATHGSPAQIGLCFAEDLARSPWPGLHAVLGWPEATTVTVMKVESPHNVISNRGPGPEALLSCAADVLATTGNNSTRWPCEQLVVINPAQAVMLDAAGWDRARVQRFLFETARVPADRYDAARYAHSRPAWMNQLPATPIVERPEDFLVVVAGGLGNQMLVAPPWGLARAVTRAVVDASGGPVLPPEAVRTPLAD